MAKRRNQSGWLFKTSLFAILASIAWWAFDRFSGRETGPMPTSDARSVASRVPEEILPEGGEGQLIKHRWYALSYNEKHEQAEWVAYELTRERLKMPWVERPGGFMPDMLVETGSANTRDYSNSGYDRGHLCPAADMAFDTAAIAETFLMSNISPQDREFNGGIWQNLEKQTRSWAKRYEALYVVSGPVLTQPVFGAIGYNKVSVPAAYYKVLLKSDGSAAIGFILPNAPSNQDFMDFAVSIDEVEKVTGLDFFPVLLKNADAARTEAALDRGEWR